MQQRPIAGRLLPFAAIAIKNPADRAGLLNTKSGLTSQPTGCRSSLHAIADETAEFPTIESALMRSPLAAGEAIFGIAPFPPAFAIFKASFVVWPAWIGRIGRYTEPLLNTGRKILACSRGNKANAHRHPDESPAKHSHRRTPHLSFLSP
jgi:hypothetical protein